MNERQLKSLIRTAFQLQASADMAVANIDNLLARTMDAVRNLVTSLPDEGLLRNKAWRDLEPLVRLELQGYGDQLGRSLRQSLEEAEPGMEAAAIRQTPLPEGMRKTLSAQPVIADSTKLILNTKINDKTLKRLFELDAPGKASPVTKALFRNVDKAVRKGIINGTPTEDIAASIAKRTMRAGIEGVDLNAPGVAKQIRGQAMAMSRTAIQDFNQQVKETVYREFDDALEGMVWEHSAALDSRTCPTCMPLDGAQWAQGNSSRPAIPIHVGCRCQQVLIDPEDPYFKENSKTAQVIRPAEKGPYDGGYKTPIRINGKTFYRKAVEVKSDTPPPRYADVLQKWAKDSSTSLNEALGPERARIFKRELDRMNADPQQILLWMLRGQPGAQRFIPLDELVEKKPLKF